MPFYSAAKLQFSIKIGKNYSVRINFRRVLKNFNFSKNKSHTLFTTQNTELNMSEYNKVEHKFEERRICERGKKQSAEELSLTFWKKLIFLRIELVKSSPFNLTMRVRLVLA